MRYSPRPHKNENHRNVRAVIQHLCRRHKNPSLRTINTYTELNRGEQSKFNNIRRSPNTDFTENEAS